MSKPTKDIVLPESGFKAFLRIGLSYGEHQQLQEVLLDGTKVDLTAKDVADGSSSALKEVPATVVARFNFENAFVRLKRLEDKEGKPIAFTRDTVKDLDLADGLFLETEAANLSQDAKKKSTESNKK